MPDDPKFMSRTVSGRYAVPILGLLIGIGLGLAGRQLKQSSSADHFYMESSKPTVPHQMPYVAMAKGRIDVEGGIIQLAASTDGLIKEVFVEEGDAVKKGQVLAVQNDRKANLNLALEQARVTQAQSDRPLLKLRLAAAERDYARILRLANKSMVARQERDRALDSIKQINARIVRSEAALKVAELRQILAEYNVTQHIVRAPMDGRIVRRLARPGDGVSTLSVTPLFWFVPDTERIVRAEVEERFVGRIKPGMRAVIVPEADEAQSYAGEVIRVGHLFGQKRSSTDDPQERVDERVVECILKVEQQPLLVGQRVLVKFKRPG